MGGGGTSSGGNGGSGGAGNGSGAGGGGGSGNVNFGGGGPGCDGTKSPREEACVIHETYALFVSPQGDDLEGDGSRAKPFKTFEHAVSQAALQKKRVYACATQGAFAEQVNLGPVEDGVSLFGGFDCSTWDYVEGKKTKIDGPNNGALVVQDLANGSTIEDFELSAKDATSPGSASMGVVVGNSKGVTLRRTTVVAGKGANGVAGYSTPGIAASGKKGNPGHPACSNTTSGGAESVTGCGFPESRGGNGGISGVGPSTGGSGVDGEPNLGGGVGGVGQDDTLPGGWSCAIGTGQDGKPGANGDAGLGSSSPGKLSGNGWSAAAGEFGGDGGNGQGGGGGGGAKAPASCGPTGPSPARGASGGGGGSGGCGGIGGEGGKGGGASIALSAYASEVTLEACTLTASVGGTGGAGGKGQLGGAGASGAGGGTGACSGGSGAKGGDGGHGGGGAGGPSLGVAYLGKKPILTQTSVQVPSTHATGGADGVGQTSGPGAGAPGVSAQEFEFL